MAELLGSPEFWVAIAFAVLVVVIAKPVARAVAAMLDARTERIRKTLDDAARVREEAQHLLAEYQRRQRDAAKECEEIIAQARAEAERLAREAAEKLETALKRRQQMALEKIAQAEAEALQEVRDTTVDIAIAATRRLLAARLDAEAGRRMVDRAIAELPHKLH